MKNIDEKIRDLIEKSLFLDRTKKDKVLKTLGEASVSEKQKLLRILEGEKTGLEGFLNKSLQKDGKNVVEKMNRSISKVKKNVSKIKESRQIQSDFEEAESLFD